LQRLRAVVDKYPGRVLVGETWTSGANGLAAYYGPKNNEVQLPMYLELVTLPFSAAALRPRIEAVENNPAGGWPCVVLSNHDIARTVTRYTPPGGNPDDVAKVTSALLLTLRGTPVLYYGEEIGMRNHDPKRLEDVQDVIGRKGWPKEKGRDGERTPMQWDASVNAGFNRGAKPWLPVGEDYKALNAAADQADAHSVLNWYRALIRLRRENPAFEGDFVSVDRKDPDVLGFLRAAPRGTALVLLNLSAKPRTVSLADAQVRETSRVLLANGARRERDSVHLESFGVLVAEATR
jgi:alpha-glucosidase